MGGGYSGSAGGSGPAARSAAPAGPGAARPAAAPPPPFQKGDTGWSDKAFGRGHITGLTPMGGDALVEIAFETSDDQKAYAQGGGAAYDQGVIFA